MRGRHGFARRLRRCLGGGERKASAKGRRAESAPALPRAGQGEGRVCASELLVVSMTEAAAAAAAVAARQARVAHLSLDGALEEDAGASSLQAFEAASQELQSPIAAVRQGAEAALLQLRAPGMEAAQHAIQTCREVLNSSDMPAAQFQAALAVRDVLMRDWHLLPPEALVSLREEMLQTTISRVLTPPGAVPFVRQQLLQLVALMFKRVWLSDGAAAAKDALVAQVSQLLGAPQDSAQSLGIQLLLAVLNEFSFSRLTAVGMTWEFHLLARYSFQQDSLLRFFSIIVEWLDAWEGRVGEGSEGAAAALEMTSVVLDWNFLSKEAAASAPAAGSVWATESAIKDEILNPPVSWRSILTGAGGLRLLNVLFSGATRHRNNPHLTRHYREALLGIARLGGGDLWENAGVRAGWQQAAIGGTLAWLQGLQEPAASGDQVRDACGLLLRLLNGGAGAALCCWGDGGAEGARAVGVIAQVCVRACALQNDDGSPYTSTDEVRSAQEEWQQEGVVSALRLW